MQNEQQIFGSSSRRAFLRDGALILAAGCLDVTSAFAAENEKPALKIGLVTDLHYADRAPGGSRHYRETPDKLAEAAEQFGKDSPEFIVEL